MPRAFIAATLVTQAGQIDDRTITAIKMVTSTLTLTEMSSTVKLFMLA